MVENASAREAVCYPESVHPADPFVDETQINIPVFACSSADYLKLTGVDVRHSPRSI